MPPAAQPPMPNVGNIVLHRGVIGGIRPAIVTKAHGVFCVDLFIFPLFGDALGNGGSANGVTHANPVQEPGCMPSWYWPHEAGGQDRVTPPEQAATAGRTPPAVQVPLGKAPQFSIGAERVPMGLPDNEVQPARSPMTSHAGTYWCPSCRQQPFLTTLGNLRTLCGTCGQVCEWRDHSAPPAPRPVPFEITDAMVEAAALAALHSFTGERHAVMPAYLGAMFHNATLAALRAALDVHMGRPVSRVVDPPA